MAHPTKRRHKAYRPCPDRPLPMLFKMQYVLGPLESIIDGIERTGTVDTEAGGTPIFQPYGEKTWCASVPAIIGIVDFFDMWATRHNHPLNLEGLRQLAKRLEYAMPLTQANIDAARAVMTVLRRIAPRLDHDDAQDLLRQTQIKDELEAA